MDNWTGGSLRNTQGQFASAKDVSVNKATERDKNKGNQSYSVDRFEISGVTLNMASIEAILNQPWVLAHVEKLTKDRCDTANNNAITEGAEYGMIVYNNRPELGPVGVVYCGNYKSVVDDMYHDTLFKTLAGSPNASKATTLGGGSDQRGPDGTAGT